MIALLIIFDVGLTDKEPTYGINGCFSKTKENAATLVKQRQNFAWVCIIILIIVICLLMKKNP